MKTCVICSFISMMLSVKVTFQIQISFPSTDQNYTLGIIAEEGITKRLWMTMKKQCLSETTVQLHIWTPQLWLHVPDHFKLSSDQTPVCVDRMSCPLSRSYLQLIDIRYEGIFLKDVNPGRPNILHRKATHLRIYRLHKLYFID